jgi:prepilin-type N-terminal cleavage/methylation domain-containing protein
MAYAVTANAEARVRPCTAEPLGRAYSLIELLLVLAIIAIMAAVATPRYSQALSRYRSAAAARRIVDDLALARVKAYTSSESKTVRFDAANNQLIIEGIRALDTADATYVVNLSDPPYHATLVSVDFAGQPNVTFDGYGMPNAGGTVVVESAGFKTSIVLDAHSAKAAIP